MNRPATVRSLALPVHLWRRLALAPRGQPRAHLCTQETSATCVPWGWPAEYEERRISPTVDGWLHLGSLVGRPGERAARYRRVREGHGARGECFGRWRQATASTTS